ncbi:16S rRNA (guanine966-N2)-methyltransferase [Actinopolyspora lacussalsi]|uniref:16S rRNA (Guanine966-N2)-methyltransferase n=1 Tax=Actinopolyspora righensis TaxID=995060 RepID=A0A1I7C7I5_9ACTN|nr:16S rRNA (guanine(966)-N(2))-methyltransferase RsmD [Actinopolyspora righensis]MDP9640248.1 16S rRNA (guanine966-N2)-methyltransferase [Actinopolyspora lacussalsi]SFT95378.1 16S rRNA (guanine966-N2)-methyltransferase [Actinopolyspora righensis]
MTRIVAGTAGGRRIEVPQRGTRPVTERVREALFSALEAMTELSGTRVLDLFAGSGGFGFEALSRGAEHATFVESDRRAAGVLRRNAETLGFRSIGIEQSPVRSVLTRSPGEPYDLVFADPPFAMDSAELDECWQALVRNDWLNRDGLVIVERFWNSPAPVWPAGIEELRNKRYGDAAVYWAERVPPE